MELKETRRTSLCAMAAAAGTGFSSGQGVVLFFSQTGNASWLGIIAASVMFGLLMGLLCRYRPSAGFLRASGNGMICFVTLLHSLLMSLVTALMLIRAGELGALALPANRSFLWGMLIALAVAVIINGCGSRGLAAIGGVIVVFAAAFHGALALDPRPVRMPVRMETELRWENSGGMALLLAMMFACMNGTVAGCTLRRDDRKRLRPLLFGLLTGVMMFAQLLCMNSAVCRGGKSLCGAKLPTVILAARWGTAGFWLSIGFMYLCAAATLSAVLGEMMGRVRSGGRDGRTALLMLIAAFLMCCAFGIDAGNGGGYSAAGWICALGMALLAFMHDGRNNCVLCRKE